MVLAKKSNNTVQTTFLSKKQQIEAVNRLCIELYLKYKAEINKYSLIKTFLDNNKAIYLWVNWDILCNSLCHVAKVIWVFSMSNAIKDVTDYYFIASSSNTDTNTNITLPTNP